MSVHEISTTTNKASPTSKRKAPSLVLTRLGRVPLLLAGIVSLLLGIWGGLLRLPVTLPLPSQGANWITFHGPLMVCAFLGTVISLERAVGLQRLWTYAAPVLTAAGGVWMLTGGLGKTGVVLILSGSVLFLIVSVRVVWLSRTLFSIVMALGAGAWVVGNGLWYSGWGFNRIVPWWIAFLALIIVGERLDLTRFQRLGRWAQPVLLGSLGLYLGGVIVAGFGQVAGERIAGLGLLAIALWLVRWDIARRTVHQPGLPRFMALCLLSGYFWMALSGGLLVITSPLESGLKYDAVLHAFFVGFVFSMIFGHAPVIFPAILHFPAAYYGRFYAHLVLLHAALALRVIGDLSGWGAGRTWGGILNSVAIALFLLNTVSAIVQNAFRTSTPHGLPGRGQPGTRLPADGG